MELGLGTWSAQSQSGWRGSLTCSGRFLGFLSGALKENGRHLLLILEFSADYWDLFGDEEVERLGLGISRVGTA